MAIFIRAEHLVIGIIDFTDTVRRTKYSKSLEISKSDAGLCMQLERERHRVRTP